MVEKYYSDYTMKQKELNKLTVVGYGIIQDNKILSKIIKILKIEQIEIFDINLSQNKIEIILNKIDNKTLTNLHKELIKGGNI